MKTNLRILFLFVAFASVPAFASDKTALDEYLVEDNGVFSFTRYATERRFLYTTYFLTMTSQQWRDSTEVDRPIWEHTLTITVPRGVRLKRNHTAILFIDGGNNDDAAPTVTDEEIALLAVLSQSVVVVIQQVPNQPLMFADETRQRSEDAILAYSLDKFLQSCNEDASQCDDRWPVHLAMTKSAVRAMDTAQKFLVRKFVFIEDFIVVGASKRGWTAWLTAAGDKRVKAVVPVSIDTLNIRPQLDRHWAAYGGTYSSALDDYTELDVFCNARGNPKGTRLNQIIDPYEYRDRLTMPKLVVNSAGDQFFVSDSSQLYYKDLSGMNRLRYTFNTDHSHAQNGTDQDIVLRAISWINDVNRGRTPPDYTWEVQGDKLIVQALSSAKEVWLWQATDAEDPTARDFRLETIGAAWSRSPLEDRGGGRYEATLIKPDLGWTAYSIELVFKGKNILEADHIFTTDVVVVSGEDTELPLDPETHCAPDGTNELAITR